MGKKEFLLMFCIAFVLCIGNVSAAGCNNGTYDYICGETIYESCTMNSDLSFTGTCFTIGSDNIVIDGNGFTITGDKEIVDNDYGISIVDKENIIIKNITLSNFHNGVNALSSDNIEIINSSLILSDQWGVYLEDSSNSLIKDCFIAHVKNDDLGCGGLFIYGGEKNMIENNHFTNTSGDEHYGAVRLQYSNYNNITNNRMEDMVGWGVDSQHSNFTIVESNYMRNVKPAGGPYIHGRSFNCRVINNTIHNCCGGIVFHTPTTTGSGHVAIGNEIIGSTDKGIDVIRTHGTILKDNYFEGNIIGIRFWSSFNCELIDSQVYSSVQEDVVSETIIYPPTFFPNNSLINTSFGTSRIDGGVLYRKWYLDVFVKLVGWSSPYGSEVRAYDVGNNLHFSEITDLEGNLARQRVIEYYETDSGRTYLTEYSINATNDGRSSDTEYFNLTTNLIDKDEIILKIKRGGVLRTSKVKQKQN